MPAPPVKRHNTLRQYKRLKKLEKRGKARVVQTPRFGGLKPIRGKPNPPSRPSSGERSRTRVVSRSPGGLRVSSKSKNKGGGKSKPKFRTVTKTTYQPYAQSAPGSSSSGENMSGRRAVVTKIKQRIKNRKKK